MNLTVTRDGLRDGDRLISLISGEVHYWRLDPDRWGDVLASVADLGFPTVSTYIPWAVHDRGEGSADFTGQLDVGAFLDLVAEHDLSAIVRIGPDCGAETPTSGWPRWLVDDPRTQARRPDGSPYLLVSATSHMHPPSYASSRVRDAVGGWYDLIIPHLVDRQHPDGAVVAVQVDNEFGYHFQSNTFALDHHPEFVAGFRRFLRERHRTIDALNNRWGTDHDEFDEIEAPTDAGDAPEQRRLDWVAWREAHVRESVGAFAGMAQARGIDRVPIVHNHHPRTESPIDIGTMESTGTVAVCGADVYVTRHGAGFARDLVRHLCGSTTLPWLAELGAGWLALPWLLPMGIEAIDEEHVALRTLLGGARAANVYMLVDRDRWYGSPIGADGSARGHRADTWRQVLATIRAADLVGMERDAPVLLVENRAETRRIAARDTLADVVPSFSQIMPLDTRLATVPHADSDAYRAWYDAVAGALGEAGVDHDRASSTALPDLGRYRLVLMPTLDTVDRRAWTALTDSGVPVVIGPRRPSLDEDLAPWSPPGEPVLLEDPTALAALLPEPAWRSDDSRVELVRWVGRGREVVVTTNPTDDALTADLTTTLDTTGTLRDVATGDTAAIEQGTATVSLRPWAVRAWEVAR